MAPLALLTGLLACVASVAARKPTLQERQIPADPEGVMTITSPQGASIRFKQPGKQGICETKEGVDDYAGYISLDEKTNMFFWFFEARENPSEKPVSTPLFTLEGVEY
jgi:carboxypeptidase C (cathepsin A)